MLERQISLTLPNAGATASRAAALGQQLGAGDVILLSGDVGAGKTHFARALILSLLEEPEDVPSPTFTLVQTYEALSADIWHADLYRLTSTTEIEELGLVDAFETAICLVEWPDRLGDLTPPDALYLHFAQADAEDTRQLTATWQAAHWDSKLSDWRL